jgi:hypothetical protein
MTPGGLDGYRAVAAVRGSAPVRRPSGYPSAHRGRRSPKWRTARRKVVAAGFLVALAVPAFLIGAALAGPGPAPVSSTPDAAGGQAAQDSVQARPDQPSPASQRRSFRQPLPPVHTPSPSAPAGAAGLTVTLTTLDPPPEVDDPVRFRVRWSDGAGRYAGIAEHWGDGTEASSAEPVSCAGPAGAHSGELTSQHTFTAAGRYRVRFTVTTSDCAGHRRVGAATTTVLVSGPAESEDDTSTPTTSAPGVPPEPSSLPSPLPSVPPLGGPDVTASASPTAS